MNKAFIAICFWQSLPDLPPLGRHVPLTAFYRLVKAEKLFSFFFYFVCLVGWLVGFCCRYLLTWKMVPLPFLSLFSLSFDFSCFSYFPPFLAVA